MKNSEIKQISDSKYHILALGQEPTIVKVGVRAILIKQDGDIVCIQESEIDPLIIILSKLKERI